jgi:membrane-bound inhibitor of C-type lysozyme
MISTRPLAVVLTGVLALAACDREAAEPAQPVPQETPAAPAIAPAGPSIDYDCETGETVRVQYIDTETAQLTYKGQTSVMRLAVSGSGARYVGSGLEWWTASRDGQENATLSRISPSDQVGTAVLERCSRPSTNPDLPPPGQPSVAAAVAGAPCRTADLRLAAGEGDAGAGHRAQILTLTNAGATPCSLSGNPAVSLLDADGRPVSGVRADQNPGTSTPVTLTAGGRAFFDIAWTVVPDETQGQTPCPTATRVAVRFGVDTASLAVPLTLTPCGGRIRVNPIRAAEEIAATPEAA